jgi:spore maturation protein CgeD
VKVTVVLTVYNAGVYLPKAVASVLRQTHPDLELLIMDDGSTDQLVEATLAEITDRRVTILRHAPTAEERAATTRYATLINRAVLHSTGHLITYLCGDDYYADNRLERMVAKIAEGHHVVYGAQLLLNEHGQPFGIRETEGVLDDAYHRVDHNSVMHTRAAFNNAGGWDDSPEHWSQADAIFWRRLTAAGYQFHPVAGGPTDAKHHQPQSVAQRLYRGEHPWQ